MDQGSDGSWKEGLDIQTINCPTINIFEKSRINTQLLLLNKEIMLIHAYIPPDVNNKARARFWKAMEQFADEQNMPTIITGDLNTKDKRFGKNHEEHHEYLDSFLMEFSMINNINTPTRGSNNLDITLCNQEFLPFVQSWKAHASLSSDHLPTIIKTTIPTSRQKRTNTLREPIKIIDNERTMNKLMERITYMKRDQLTLTNIHKIIAGSIHHKTIRRKGCPFWNDELRIAYGRRNCAKTKWQQSIVKQHRADRIEKRKRKFQKIDTHFKNMLKNTNTNTYLGWQRKLVRTVREQQHGRC
uniref:Endonuclease/exonuclease/phosphatase domain-containing protein n=1 Tax=Spongospora subterranea TaxID=70186 RepID=A0A0H5RH13_9EUKA|eukprot:CRZ07979.1 hypothetical protein [Spongospora subterranea]